MGSNAKPPLELAPLPEEDAAPKEEEAAEEAEEEEADASPVLDDDALDVEEDWEADPEVEADAALEPVYTPDVLAAPVYGLRDTWYTFPMHCVCKYLRGGGEYIIHMSRQAQHARSPL